MDNNLKKLKSALANVKPEQFKENVSENDHFENEDIIELLKRTSNMDSNSSNLYSSYQAPDVDYTNNYTNNYITIPNGGYATPIGPQGATITFGSSMGANGAAGPSTTSWATAGTSSIATFNSDAEFHGDIKWQGRSLGNLLNKIEERLAILTPNMEKLEHFDALKKAYDHYKTLEALCQLPDKQEEK